MADEYAKVSRGKLKLKDDNEIKKRKKKKKCKDKEQEKMEKAVQEAARDEALINAPREGRKLTKAELSFKKMQEKMQNKRIAEKASKTHKQQVEKFNEHLDSLTEHFDIPKVSWTK